MDNKKKYIIAIVLFVFLGLTIFTFANPGDEEEKLKGNNTEQKEQIQDEEENTDTNGGNVNAGTNNEQINQANVAPVVLTDNSYDLALEAVINAEEKIDEDSYEAAVDLVNKVTNNDQKETLEERLEEVKNGIDAKALVEELTKQVETSENKDNMDGAREFRTDEEVVEKVNALANEELKEELKNQLATLALLLDDTAAPVVKDENGDEITNKKILSKTTKLFIEDENTVVATVSEEGSNESNELGDDYTAGEGTYTLTLRDKAFNEKVVTFTIDLSNPEINVVNKSHSTGNIDVVITDATFKYVEIYNQDAKTKVLSTNNIFTLEDEATYRITAYDETGRKTVVWTAIDSVYPTISGVVNNAHYNEKEIEITVEDKFLMDLEVTGPDGTEVFTRTDFTVGKNKEDYSYVYTATKEGTYTVVATDKAGNPTTVTFTIDRTKPILTNVVNGGYYKSVTPGVIEENFKNATLKLNGKTIKSYKVGDTLTKEGTYTLVVTDKAMNKSNNGAITFVVDSTPAEISVSTSNNNGNWSTNQDVIATLKSNEVINTPEGWTVVIEGMEFTKVYTNNEKVSFKVTDLTGNETPVSFEVKRIDKVKPTLTIINPEKYQLEVNTEFVDPGYSAYDVLDKDVTKLVKKAYKFQAKGTDTWEEVDSIDTTKLGLYEIIYTAYDKAGNIDTGSRQVEIVDTTAPVLVLNGEKDVYIEAGDEYIELGVTVTDNYDADRTRMEVEYINHYDLNGVYQGRIKNKVIDTKLEGKYLVVYQDKDSNGNISEKVTRWVIVTDTTAPTVTANLDENGNKDIYINQFDEYTELGATVKDNADATRTIGVEEPSYINLYKFDGTFVKRVSKVDTSVPGKYSIVYVAKDKAGNVSNNQILTAKRWVIVSDRTASNDNELESLVKENGTIKLDSNITLNESKTLVVKDGVTLVIDLNGKELTNSIQGLPALKIEEGATVTIKNGTLVNENINAQKGAVIHNYGTLIIEGDDTVIGSDLNRGAAVENWGTLTVNGGTFATMDRSHPSNGFAYVFINYGGTMTINNAKVDGNPNGIFYAYAGTINVNGGTYKIGNGSANTWYVAYAETGATINLNAGEYTWKVPGWNTIDATIGNVIISDDCTINW